MAQIKRIISPDDWRSRQIDTLKSVGEKNYKTGIANPKDDPIAAGLRAEDKYANEVKKAIEAKSRVAGLKRSSMEEWYGYSVNIGAPALVNAVVKREAKVKKFIDAFQPMLSSHLVKVDALAEATDSDREQKMLENLRGLKALAGKA